jgi:putative spermidine/putrescine transport system ATP-binding protein
VRLSRAAAAGDATGLNAVTGRVAAIEYQGTWLKITIDEACGEEFVVNVPDNVFFADPVKVGDTVLAQWNAQEVHFLDGHSTARIAAPQLNPAAAVASS